MSKLSELLRSSDSVLMKEILSICQDNAFRYPLGSSSSLCEECLSMSAELMVVLELTQIM